MEAAPTLTSIPEQLRSRRFARECEELRPHGVAFILRRYGNTLDHADAEDAVSEVLIRLHRLAEAGRPPENLRAAFFTSARNAAIDQLRSRSAKPTVALELVAEAPLAEPSPEDRAELADDAVRLREAMGRMRPNYREAIVLRFGLGLTVPEMADRLDVSLPAAKKRVLRATGEIRRGMESIEGAEFCPEMREQAQRSLFDRDAAGLLDPGEENVLRAHFEHCGSCRTFLAALHGNLHQLGSTALITGFAAERSGASHHLAAWFDHVSSAAHAGLAKLRLSALKATGAFSSDGSGAAGALAGSSQKIAAICAGGAATATCLATGIIGPGIGVVQTDSPAHHARPSAQDRSALARGVDLRSPLITPSTQAEPAPHAAGSSAAKPQAQPVAKLRQRTKSPESAAGATASRQGEEEFGFEGETEATAATSTSSSSSASASSSESAPPPPASSTAPSSSSATPSGHEKFGFGG